MKEPKVLGSLLHIMYEGAQDSDTLLYALCRKEPQVLGSLLHILYVGSQDSKALWYAMCTKARRQVGAVRAGLNLLTV